MHRKGVFALAGVFLAVAFVVPIVVFTLQADRDLDNYVIVQNPSGMQTGGNVTSVPSPEEIAEQHTTAVIMVVIVEVVFVSLFIITMYVGINHLRPKQENH